MNMTPLTIELLLKESFFGLLVLAAVAIFNIYCFAWITLAYRRSLSKAVYRGQHVEILRFVAFIMLIVIAMLTSLSIWVFALVWSGFVTDALMALLFVASFFTSVGNVTLELPFGWRFIPSIIAFSGLFSFAWATASSIGMANHLASYLEKHKS